MIWLFGRGRRRASSGRAICQLADSLPLGGGGDYLAVGCKLGIKMKTVDV
jgi:hypothetical protein